MDNDELGESMGIVVEWSTTTRMMMTMMLIISMYVIR